MSSCRAFREASREVGACGMDFLTEGDVFTEDLIETYINYKYENEINPVRLRPTPQEFEMYYDC